MSAEQVSTLELRAGRFYPSVSEMKHRLSLHPFSEEITRYVHDSGGDLNWLFEWPKERRGTLTDIGILRHMIAGNIEIEPFDSRLLQSNGYDVRLGEFYYAHNGRLTGVEYEGQPLYVAQEPSSVSATWATPLVACSVHELIKSEGFVDSLNSSLGLKNLLRDPKILRPTDRVIVLKRLESILGHTQEFIGGANVVTTRISGKSSVGRSMIEVCSDANLGDVGFVNRWALEITNKSNKCAVLIIVGQTIATITFEEVEPSITRYKGEYQPNENPGYIKNTWRPASMLPRWKRFEGDRAKLVVDTSS